MNEAFSFSDSLPDLLHNAEKWIDYPTDSVFCIVFFALREVAVLSFFPVVCLCQITVHPGSARSVCFLYFCTLVTFRPIGSWEVTSSLTDTVLSRSCKLYAQLMDMHSVSLGYGIQRAILCDWRLSFTRALILLATLYVQFFYISSYL